MIHRIWHGWAPPHCADAYQQLVDGEVVPGILARGIAGVRQVDILRRCDTADRDVEFVTVMAFDDWSAVEAFSGGTTSYVPAAAQALLSRFDPHAAHYNVVARHMSGQ